jgi:hypothetical protein
MMRETVSPRRWTADQEDVTPKCGTSGVCRDDRLASGKRKKPPDLRNDRGLPVTVLPAELGDGGPARVALDVGSG